MNPHMTADTQGHQQVRSILLVAMMDYQRRALAAATAAKAVARQHAFTQAGEKAQRMTAPVIT